MSKADIPAHGKQVYDKFTEKTFSFLFDGVPKNIRKKSLTRIFYIIRYKKTKNARTRTHAKTHARMHSNDDKPPQRATTTKSDRKQPKKGTSDRSFVEKNVVAAEGGKKKSNKKREEGEEEKEEKEEEEEREKKDPIKAWEEKNSKPGWNVAESSCPLSEEQVHELEAYFCAGKKRARLAPRYALYILDEDEDEEYQFSSKNKLGVTIPGVATNVVDAKRLVFSTDASCSVFVKLFDEKIDEKIKVSEAQCLKKEMKGLAKFLTKSFVTVAILPVGKRITREAYQKMQKEGVCVIRSFVQKHVKHASEHHSGPSARRSEQIHPI